MSRADAESFPHVALSVRAHNREALHRTDAEWVAERWEAPGTQVLVVSEARVHPDPDHLWTTPDRAPLGERVLLGHRDGVTRFAVFAHPDDVPGGTDGWVGLRGHFGLLAAGDDVAADQAPWLFHAIGLAEWRRAVRFCPRCRGDLDSRSAGHELVCRGCGRSQFPRTDPAVIMAITTGEPDSDEEAVLLGRQRQWPVTQWSTLAGFCEPGETLEDAVRRETYEETGVHVGQVDYFGSQPWPLPASLMVAFTGRATSTEVHVDGAEIEDARWFTRRELAEGFTDGSVTVPRSVSISSSLISHWYGAPLGGRDRWR